MELAARVNKGRLRFIILPTGTERYARSIGITTGGKLPYLIDEKTGRVNIDQLRQALINSDGEVMHVYTDLLTSGERLFRLLKKNEPLKLLDR